MPADPEIQKITDEREKIITDAYVTYRGIQQKAKADASKKIKDVWAKRDQAEIDSKKNKKKN